MVASGAVSGGMRPKLAAVKNALAAGVKSVHLVGGYAPDSLLIEVFTNEGAGTMIRRDEPA
jgi:acetylglutamate kinase